MDRLLTVLDRLRAGKKPRGTAGDTLALRKTNDVLAAAFG